MSPIRRMQTIIGHIHCFNRVRVFIRLRIKWHSNEVREYIIPVFPGLRIFQPLKIDHVFLDDSAIMVKIHHRYALQLPDSQNRIGKFFQILIIFFLVTAIGIVRIVTNFVARKTNEWQKRRKRRR